MRPPMMHSDDVVLGVLPLFHVYGLNAVLGGVLRHRAKLVLAERFDREGTLDLIEDEACSVVPVAPPVFAHWHDIDALSERLGPVRLVLSGSAPLSAEAIEAFSGQWWSVVGILWVLMLYVTMVYGPIAAMLVELFPTRIRYTSMSLPYHIGNGWFGGLLPATGLAIVAQTGNMYNGLWYPIIFASITFVIGMLFVRETKDVDIYRHD